MSRTPAPGPREDGPRSLSSLLRALDGAPTGAAPGVDLAAAVRDGGRRRRRRHAAGAGAALVAVTAVLALGAGWVDPAPTGPVTPTATAASVTGSADGPTADELLDRGWSRLLPGQLETPGVPDDAQPAVLVDPGRSEIAAVVDTGGCWEQDALEVVSQTPGLLELRYVDQDDPETFCDAVAVVATYELPLSAPVAEGAVVVLELPDARTDSPGDVPGRELRDLAPGEVPVDPSRVVMTERSTYADGSSRDQLFLDATGTRLRLRFAFSICATAVLRPPVETAAQVDLRIVVTDPGTGCVVEPFYAEDFLVTLDAPLGERRIVVTEETRIVRGTSDDPAWRAG